MILSLSQKFFIYNKATRWRPPNFDECHYYLALITLVVEMLLYNCKHSFFPWCHQCPPPSLAEQINRETISLACHAICNLSRQKNINGRSTSYSEPYLDAMQCSTIRTKYDSNFTLLLFGISFFLSFHPSDQFHYLVVKMTPAKGDTSMSCPCSMKVRTSL